MTALTQALLNANILDSEDQYHSCEVEMCYAAPPGKRCCCIVCEETANSYAEVYMEEPKMQIVYVCVACIARAEGREAPQYAKGGQVVMAL